MSTEGKNIFELFDDFNNRRINRILNRWGGDDYLSNAEQNTIAINEADEFLIDAYFVKKNITIQKTENLGSPSKPYRFRSANTYVSDENYDRIVSAIVTNYNEELASENLYTTNEQVSSVLANDTGYPSGTELNVPVYTIEESENYERIKAGNLGQDVYIVVYGFFGKGVESTILIKEKEPKLTEASETLQVHMYQNEEDTSPQAVRELKATFDDGGKAIVKIKFHPGNEETFKGWQEALTPPKLEGGAPETSLRPKARPDHLGQEVGPFQVNDQEDDGLEIIKNYAELYLDVTVNGQRTFQDEFLKPDTTYFILTNDCCSQDLSSEQIKNIAIHASNANIEKHLVGLNQAFKDNEINTCLRKLHFLAQVIHESGSFRYTREIGVSNSAYGGFPGRGLIQLTLRGNYEAYGNFIGEDFLSSQENKEKLERDPHAARSAGWFWSQNAELNDDADENDFIFITFVINGGFNGYNDRLEYVKKGVDELLLSCSNSNMISTDYRFEESKTYDYQKGSFGWGVWHDAGTNKSGCTKNREKAILGYERFVDLNNRAGQPTPSKNWYGYKKEVIRSFVEERLRILKNI